MRSSSSIRPLVALGIALVLVACSGGGSGGGSGPGSDVDGGSGDLCPEGFALDLALGACTEIAAANCPGGTMPMIGHADCQPVGWTSACPDGFEREPSGWGCLDHFKAKASTCPGAQREDMKSGSCVPIGDCNAPFPPANAKLFVDPLVTEDATHVHTLGQAMAKAKPGDTIAVESGTYPEVVDLLVDNVSVVGRCAEKVLFKGPVGPRAGMYVSGTAGAKVSGLTVSGFVGGVLLEGGDLTAADVMIDGNDQLGIYLRFGARATLRRSKISHTRRGTGALGSASIVYDGSALTFEDSALVDNYFRHASVDGAGSTLSATSTVFARNGKLTGDEASISLVKGGSAKLARCAVLDSYGSGIRVEGSGSHADVEESVIRRSIGVVASSGGIGVLALTGGTAKLVSSAVTDHPGVGVYAGTGGAVVTLMNSVLLGIPVGGSVDFGRCASAADTGRLEVASTAVVGCPQSGVGLQHGGVGTFDGLYVKDSWPTKQPPYDKYGGFGMLVEDSSDATVMRSSFVGNSLAGMTSTLGATVTAEAVLIRDTHELPSLTAGSGVQLARDGSMTMTRCALSGNSQESILVATGGHLVMKASTVHGTRKSADGAFGHGVTLFTGATVELTDIVVYDSDSVGLISDGGSAIVRGGTFARSQVALHAQNGASITQSDATGELATGEVRVSSSTRFVDNASRLGSGIIPVPPAPLQ